MAGGSLLKTSGLAALAAGLAMVSLPALAQDIFAAKTIDAPQGVQAAQVVLAQAEGRGPGGRGGWRDNGGGNGGGSWRGGGAVSDGGGSGGGWQGRGQRSEATPQPAPQAAPQVVQQAPQAQSNWRGNGGGGNWQGRSGGGSWRGNARSEPMPQAAPPVAQQAPQGQSGWAGRSGSNTGGEWRGRGRGEGQQGAGSRWGGNAQPVPQAQAPQQTERSRQGGNRQTWRGEAQGGGQDWRARGGTSTYRQDGNRDWNRNDRRGDNNRWNGNNAYRDDNNRWNGNNRGGYNNNRWGSDNRRWSHDWRRDNRYNWQSYRSHNRDTFRMGRYYAPYRGYSYSRLSVGFYLDSLFFGSNYWINDPWQYRLPEVYGPYRWVRYYDDAVLVDVYSGEVVDVIYDFFW